MKHLLKSLVVIALVLGICATPCTQSHDDGICPTNIHENPFG